MQRGQRCDPVPTLLSLLCPNVGFNSWQPPVRSHFRPRKSSLRGPLVRICMRRRRLDEINLAELTSVQLHLLAPLLLCLALVLTVSGDDPLVVDIRLHPRLPAIGRYERWVVKWVLRRCLLGAVVRSGLLHNPGLLLLVPQVGLHPRASVRRSSRGGEAQGYGGGGNRRVDQTKSRILATSIRDALAPSSIFILGKYHLKRRERKTPGNTCSS